MKGTFVQLILILISVGITPLISNLWRKRSIPTHSEWLYPLTFDAGNGLKEA
jgi:hypothetical protein